MAALSTSIPSPIGGINAISPIDTMAPTDAIVLENWFPETAKVTVRKGYAEHATGVGSGEVETVMVRHGSTEKLLAASATNIYDASSAGTASSLVGSKNSGRYQSVNFGGYLVMANGADTPMHYNGSTLANVSYTHASLTVSTIKQVQSFKGRLYFAANNDAKFYYLPTGSVVGGALSDFDLSQIASRGGVLTAIGEWSREGGEGLASVIVFVMSTGEIIVYSGDDPSDNFVLVGSYFAGQPIGDRPLVNIGGDLIVITSQGFLPVSLLLRGGAIEEIEKTTIGKIRQAAVDSTTATGSVFGWSAITDPSDNKLVVNFPVSASTTFEQYVYNITSGAWTKFTGIPARHWARFGGVLYFGGTGGKVYKTTGTTDAGAAISVKAKQAFTYFDDRTSSKRITSIRPVIQLDGSQAFKIALDTDYSNQTLTATNHTITGLADGSAWDDPAWDDGIWAGDATPNVLWLGQTALGRNFSLRVEASVTGQNVSWLVTDYLGEIGGPR